MFTKITLILFISSTSAKLNINITLTSSKASTIIKYSGYDHKLVTEKEIKLFNVTDENLNRGFLKELGRIPETVFLKDPTVHGDIFDKFEWKPTNRSIKITKINIEGIINEKIPIIATKLINRASNDIKYDYSMLESVENMVNSTWSSYGLPDDDVSYDLNIKYALTHYSFIRHWRGNKPVFKTSLFGINNTGELILQPGDVFRKELSGKRTFLVLNVTYEASLSGRVVGCYDDVFGKYYFWSPSIGDIMKAADLSNKIETTEEILIVWHTDPEEVVTSDVTKAVVLSYFPEKPYRAADKKSKLLLKKQKKIKAKKCDCSKPEDCNEKERENLCVPKPDGKKNKYRVLPPKSKWRIIRT